ncbi:MAG TPA: peptide ABC transporter permease [Sutterella sp.]|nr:peptide ABC transporter permease [Sutterella sp.]
MEPVKFVVLYTDVVMWLLVLLLGVALRHALRSPSLRAKWRRVADNRTAVACAAVLLAFLVIALADSVHYRSRIGATPQGEPVYATATSSLLDDLVGRHIAGRERSYSVPFAIRDFDKTPVIREKGAVREFQRLKGVAAGLTDEEAVQKRGRDLALGLGAALAASGAGLALAALLAAGFGKPASWLLGRTNRARPALFVLLGILALSGFLAAVWPGWHVLGTDSTGNDVLMSALKSIRTAVVIGSLATLSALPFAMAFGICAGYFRGWVDDVVQYVYTTISSIPSVLLIAASVLMIQVFIDKNPAAFETGLERADVRLFSLALIIGVTSWAGLARLLRAETMKVASLDFVTAAHAFGLSAPAIMLRHVVPNVVHIVLIVAVLDFSGIVLYEAVLSYVGVGVDPVTESFGTMINAAASEMSRTPAVWWNLVASFLFMFTLVLSANLFAAGVRDAFDPRGGRRR